MTPDILASEIHRHNIAYWKNNAPVISDEEYDKLVESLRKISPNHPILSELIESDSKNNKIKHDKPMLSLDKVFSAEEVFKWAETHGTFAKSYEEGGGLVSSYKVDGASCSILYKDGVYLRAATRGNGKVGDDVTANVATISGIPMRLKDTAHQKVSGTIEIRGEVYMSNSSFDAQVAEFEALLKQGKAKPDDRPSNPRNLAAGSLKQKDAETTRSRNLSFMAHGSVGLGGTEQQNLWTMKQWGFQTPFFKVIDGPAFLGKVEKVVQDIDEFRRKLPYATDGIVFAINDTSRHEDIGYTGHHPKYRLAFKFAREKARTSLLDVIWETSRHGKLAPVAKVAPVDIGGASVQLCTLHNAKMVKDAALSIGDEVEIEREVIPYFLGKTKSNGGESIEMPGKCPSCGQAVEWDEPNDQNVRCDLICVNLACPAQLEGYLCHYVSRSVTDMRGVGEELVGKLLEKGLIKSPADLFRLTEADIMKVERQGDSSAKNAIAAIRSRKSQDLSMFLISLGIRHLGKDKSPKIAEKFGTIEAVRKATPNDFLAIDKVGDTLAFALCEGLKKRSDLIDDLLSVVNVQKVEKVVGILTGKSFCCSGSVSFEYKGVKYDSRPNIQDLIKSLGGEAKGSVGKSITALIAGDGAGSKIDDAKSKNVKVMTGDDFQKYLESF